MAEQTSAVSTGDPSHTTITDADWAAADALLAQEEATKGDAPKPAKTKAAKAAPAAAVEEPASEEEPDAEATEETTSDAEDEEAEETAEAATTDEDPNAKNAVQVSERIAFRKEKRAWREKIDAEVKRLNEGYAAKEAELSVFAAAKRAADVGDFDGYAKAMGFADWNEANRRYAEDAGSPGYKRLRAAERQLRELEEREAKAERERRETSEREAQQRQYHSLVTSTTKALETTGGLHAEFAKDPEFIGMVLQEKRKAFDEGDDDISDADAADRALELIAEQHAKLLERFTKYADKHKAAARFKKGGRPTEKAETRDRERMPEKGKKNHVSHSRATEAGASGRAKTDAELLKEFGFTE